MSEDQLKAFMEAVKSDPALQQKLKDLTDDAVISTAKAAGFTFTSDTLNNRELSDAELEQVAGGNVAIFCCTGSHRVAVRPED